MSGLSILEKTKFEALNCNVYTDEKGNLYMTREQIGQALEYSNPQNAIAKIHERYKYRLDKFSTIDILSTVENGRKVKREHILYNRRGIYEICRRSTQPKADKFYDWVYDLLEGLATGQLEIRTQQKLPIWQDTRADNKECSKAFNEAVKQFVDYAIANGSKHAKNYYTNFNKLINKSANIKTRDNSTISGLNNTIMAMKIATKCILSGISKGLHYREIYTQCKTQINTAYAVGLLSI